MEMCKSMKLLQINNKSYYINISTPIEVCPRFTQMKANEDGNLLVG